MEPAADSRKPLKWSRTHIIFDEEDHPDHTTAVGCLPLLVSPTIHNLKVTKMLVDGGARLTLISPKVSDSGLCRPKIDSNSGVRAKNSTSPACQLVDLIA